MNAPVTERAPRQAAAMPSAAWRVKAENPAKQMSAPATSARASAAGSRASTPLSSR